MDRTSSGIATRPRTSGVDPTEAALSVSGEAGRGCGADVRSIGSGSFTRGAERNRRIRRGHARRRWQSDRRRRRSAALYDRAAAWAARRVWRGVRLMDSHTKTVNNNGDDESVTPQVRGVIDRGDGSYRCSYVVGLSGRSSTVVVAPLLWRRFSRCCGAGTCSRSQCAASTSAAVLSTCTCRSSPTHPPHQPTTDGRRRARRADLMSLRQAALSRGRDPHRAISRAGISPRAVQTRRARRGARPHPATESDSRCVAAISKKQRVSAISRRISSVSCG